MPETKSARHSHGNPRITWFRVLCAVFGLGSAVGLFGIAVVIEWFVTGADKIHRLHNIGFGSITGIVVTTAFFVQLRNPERRIAPLQQVFAVAAAVVVASALAQDFVELSLAAILAVAGGVVTALHPARVRFLRVSRGVSPVLGVLTVAAAVPLVGYALGQASLQRNGVAGDPDVDMHHYTGMAVMAVALVLCGAVASLRTGGYRVAAWTTGLAAIVFGIASAVYRHAASSPARRWGAAAVIGGIVFILAAEWDRRRLVRE